MLHARRFLNAALAVAAAACAGLACPVAQAQGVYPCMLGDVRLFAGNFTPLYWKIADGQLLRISDYTALFSILETTYGGDGTTTFALPDLRGRIPVGGGSLGGGTYVVNGRVFGVEETWLYSQQVPPHSHTLQAATTDATTAAPAAGAALAVAQNGAAYAAASPDASLRLDTLGFATTSTQPFALGPPGLGLHYIICVDGVYPARN